MFRFGLLLFVRILLPDSIFCFFLRIFLPSVVRTVYRQSSTRTYLEVT